MDEDHYERPIPIVTPIWDFVTVSITERDCDLIIIPEI